MTRSEMTPKIVKLSIATLLLLCLLKMPYAYYQFMRIAVCTLFFWLAYIYYQEKQIIYIIASGTCIILFNPVIKLVIHKHEWQIIDLWLAIVLIVWAGTDLFKGKNGIIKG